LHPNKKIFFLGIQNQITALIRSQSYNEVFSIVIDNYSKALYAVIFKILKSHDDTNDVLQNTFIKVWHNLEKYKGDSSIYTWMYAIAKNEALGWLKKNKRYVALVSEDAIHDVYINAMGQEKIWNLLLDAVNTLPEKQRCVFEMKYFEEKKYEEIAVQTGTSVGALKASYHHAVKKIEEFIKKQNHY